MSAEQIGRLWSDDHCDWRLDYSAAWASHPAAWTVSLEWQSDNYLNPHGADWARYTWQFYGDTAEEVLAAAAEWLTKLEALRPAEDQDQEPTP